MRSIASAKVTFFLGKDNKQRSKSRERDIKTQVSKVELMLYLQDNKVIMTPPLRLEGEPFRAGR